jgi:hypothetical protein
MAFTINGFGAQIFSARGHVKWSNHWNCPADFDGLECFCLFYLPILPYRALHAYDWYKDAGEYNPNWGGRTITHGCRSMCIRWTFGLVVRTYLRAWLVVPALIGFMFLVGAVFGDRLETAKGWSFFLAGLLLTLIGVCGRFLLWLTDARNRDIRLILGPSEMFGADPATWTDDRLAKVRKPGKLFGADSYAEAVDLMLQEGEYARAMFAARLTVALGQRLGARSTGEALTHQVLTDPDVREALALVRRDRQRWYTVMNAAPQKTAPAHPL